MHVTTIGIDLAKNSFSLHLNVSFSPTRFVESFHLEFGVGFFVKRAFRNELVKVRVSPPDSDLQYVVQIHQGKRTRHKQPPPNWWSDAIQCHLDLIHHFVTCHLSMPQVVEV